MTPQERERIVEAGAKATYERLHDTAWAEAAEIEKTVYRKSFEAALSALEREGYAVSGLKQESAAHFRALAKGEKGNG